MSQPRAANSSPGVRRLQIWLEEAEARRFQRAAKDAGLTLAEWSRRALRHALRESSPTDPGRKLAAVRRAIGHEFPAPDIDQMLAEIERGYIVEQP